MNPVVEPSEPSRKGFSLFPETTNGSDPSTSSTPAVPVRVGKRGAGASEAPSGPRKPGEATAAAGALSTLIGLVVTSVSVGVLAGLWWGFLVIGVLLLAIGLKMGSDADKIAQGQKVTLPSGQVATIEPGGRK